MAFAETRSSDNKLPLEAVLYLIHHVFLPPKLPNDDDTSAEHESILLDVTLDCLDEFRDYVGPSQGRLVSSVIAAVSNLRNARNFDGFIDETKLLELLGTLCKSGETIPLHVNAQNAAVIFRPVEGSIRVEVFELSPLNHAVVNTKGRLRRSFPGPVVALNTNLFEAPRLQSNLAHTLAKMSQQPAPDTLPKVKKASQWHDEDRDTRHPNVVTELLMGFLGSMGEAVDVPRFWKNTREEVMWKESRFCWRRSPLWLLIRVTVQRAFTRYGKSTTPGEELYKEFMAFFMSRILKLSQDDSISSELLYAMNAKLARRLNKLHSSPDGFEYGIGSVQNVMQTTNGLLRERWTGILRRLEPCCNLSCLETLDFGRDTLHHLPALDEHIGWIAKRQNEEAPDIHEPTSNFVECNSDQLPTIESFDHSTGVYSAYNLSAFENWVDKNLPRWLESHKGDASTCSELGGLIQRYHEAACKEYTGNPEAMSIMLLTLIELWVACDESTTYICELLQDYDPGIPQELFQSLLLPSRRQMERLLRIEDYLDRRRTRARYPTSLIFEGFGDPSCFSVRYYNQSPEHQTIMQDINSRATSTRNQTRDKLRELKETYNSLMRLYGQSSCNYDVINERGEYLEVHSRSCGRCMYRNQANALSIGIHEWPLPRNTLAAMSTVFELQVPSFFGCWRDTTVFLLVDTLRLEYSVKAMPSRGYRLQGYPGLSWRFFGSTGRVSLLSEVKAHEFTHRHKKVVASTSESEICVNNGMRWRYYDERAGYFMDRLVPTHTIPRICMYQLPARSSSLQQFLFRPAETCNGVPSNTVIAQQCHCPEHMTLEEYKMLSGIPLGLRIQWQNILLHLSSPSIDFKKFETSLVVRQAIYQAGPSNSSNALRMGHGIAGDGKFAHAILPRLEAALRTVKENWESSQALSTFISIASRLLSLSSTAHIQKECLAYLANARSVAFGWVNLLKDKAYQSSTDDQRSEFLSRTAEIALICIDSYNVDDRFLKNILASSEAASIFIQCMIVIHDGKETLLKADDNPMVPLLLQRWKWLAYRCYPILTENILLNKQQCLDDAIKKSWSAYRVGDDWRTVSEKKCNWLMNQTASHDGVDPLWVDFDLLTGKLLVNGLPLARLPPEFEHHATYRTLFGNSTMEVMPSAVRGMKFSGKKDYAGYTLHFGINSIPGADAHDLLVQASKCDRTYELVPLRLLLGKFPVPFVDEFVHWYDFARDCLEFRPMKNPWTSSPENWRLVKVGNSRKWHLSKEGVSLISVESRTAEEISHILAPLADRHRIAAILHRHSSSLAIEVPGIQLGFSLKLGTSSIQARQFRGMTVDSDQSLGTLVGLQNKLILKNESSGSRLVVILDGQVSLQREQDHVLATIDKGSASRCHAYHIDYQLGRLIDNGSLQSKLFMCRLHAVTSFCLPDPLTQRTGTEQALSILNSAAVLSYSELTHEDLNLLEQIALITPSRSYYPKHEREMQKVIWSSDLSFLAQHNGFYKGVERIFRQAAKSQMFRSESYAPSPDLNDHVDPLLLERDCIRSSTFRVSGFGAEDHTVEHDATYLSRDRGQRSDRGARAFALSSLVYNRPQTLPFDVASGLGNRLWAFISQSPTVYGPRHPVNISELVYDANLLLEPSPSSFSASSFSASEPCRFLRENWSSLHYSLSREGNRFGKARVMIWLSTLAFAKDADKDILQTLASFVTISEMAKVPAPGIDFFEVSEGCAVKDSELRDAVLPALRPPRECPQATLYRFSTESKTAFRKRKGRALGDIQNLVLNDFIKLLKTKWPGEAPDAGGASSEMRAYIDIEMAISLAKPKFKTWFDNLSYYKYLCQIESTLRRHTVNPIVVPWCPFTTPSWNLERKNGFMSIDDVFSRQAPCISDLHNEDLAELRISPVNTSKTSSELASVLGRLEAEADSNYGKKYVEGLRQSLLSLQDREQGFTLNLEGVDVRSVLLNHLRHCKIKVREIYAKMLSAASPIGEKHNSSCLKENCKLTVGSAEKAAIAAAQTKQWPRLSPIFFLEQLAYNRWQKINRGWKHCIVQYGVALTELHRAERLLNASGNSGNLIKELQNPGHTNWSPFEHPENLLLEVESGIMIREVQEQMTREMVEPREHKNSVMQLNMGEGKSSVIVPLVASALADGTRLVRVIVAKPQSKQMFQMLVSKLGGIMGRQIYRLPFSRALRLSEQDADAIFSVCRECMRNRGILLVQPEHILSFQLMGLECLVSGKESVGRSLLRTQQYFDTSSRDIVDESDENFSVRFELVYTMGMQRPVEHSPQRWTCIQQVLDLVRRFAPIVKKELPLSVELNSRCSGSFPRTRILRPDAQQRVFNLVAGNICETGLDGFPIAIQPEPVKEAVYKYMTKADLTADEIAQVEDQGSGGFWSSSTSSTLLLLRGLIAGGVLAFTFGHKRWRVNYGLDPTRQPPTKLAVPYRAKDSPAPRSEFSHPDVVIVLTALSYYYIGLGDDDLFLALSHVLKSDQADIEYQSWVREAPGLQVAFRQLVGINLRDRDQCVKEIFPALRFAKSVIDYFLAHIVFPKEMREFPHKLSASGWDIGKVRRNPTTGFSGTNDSRKTLPLSVQQVDLQEQNHTNALVLEHLLQPKNSVALMSPSQAKAPPRSDAELLLDMVTTMTPPVQVILDVGAQIVELSNIAFARSWLSMMPNDDRTQAVVFFNDSDEVSVLDRKGHVEPLQISSFSKQLDVCLVFLDEVHTRGTDLVLPDYYRAAVTLGANLTKDRLVQACMRMRKLGGGQSVVFCVPEEIQTKIMMRHPRLDKADISVPDVLSWAISETYIDMRRSMPLWAAQGKRFECQSGLWAGALNGNELSMTTDHAKKFLEDEAQTLEYSYRPRREAGPSFITQGSSNENLNRIMERCAEFEGLNFNSATLQEEQERELSPEIEQERQVEKPAPMEPATHHLHKDLINFVSSGCVAKGSRAYMPAFDSLRFTSAAQHLGNPTFYPSLLVTADFAQTVKLAGTGNAYVADVCQRPVQWILTNGASLGSSIVRDMIIISPYEAQELMPRIRNSRDVTLHLYAPRQNRGFEILDKLDLYTVPARPKLPAIPRSLILQLNLFAGQLYLGSFNEYVEMCEFLGLMWRTLGEGAVVAADGFVLHNPGDKSLKFGGFGRSPVNFSKVLLTRIRKNCGGIDKTHMGKILNGRLLTPVDFDEFDEARY